jgi:hypothetical protein
LPSIAVVAHIIITYNYLARDIIIIMADQAGEDIFVYTGGIAPQHVVNAIIDESVEEIDNEAFYRHPNLQSVVCHAGLLKVGTKAFQNCSSLQRVKMPGAKIIETFAFSCCRSLTNVEFDKLETVGQAAFNNCTSLQRVKLPKAKTIGQSAFINSGIEDAEFGEYLETIGSSAFWASKLRRIAIPLRDEMFQWNNYMGTYTQFRECPDLTTVDLVGRIHKTVASLHFESWRNEMTEEIQRINQILPGITLYASKAAVIRPWIQSVIRNIESYKAEHRSLLKEVTTLLELALWKARLGGEEEDNNNMVVGDANDADFEEGKLAKKAKMDPDSKRQGACVTCGADVVIKNVMPFLMLE